MATGNGRATWSGKLAFVLAAAASAVGLGSMWRFPYLAAKYGGGTFLFVYLVFVFTIGISLLLLETALGRHTGLSSIRSFKVLAKKYSFIGVFMSAIPFIIVPYYCVIGGWTTKYMTAYLTDGPAALADGGDYFSAFIGNTPESMLFMLVFMALTYLVVALGVNKGIEKANLIMMPALIIVSAVLAVYALTLPGALDGLAFYLVPDVSKFSPELIIAALGQTFFTLSLAMGIMITYGSYMRKQDSLTSSVVRIGGFDLGVSFIAGLLIVSAAFVAMGSGDAVAAKAGPSLMFVTLPTVFVDMGGMATFIGFLFFLLVLFAALTSAISLVETLVSIVHDGLQCTRAKALGIVIAFVVIAGAIINAGYNGLSFIEPLGAGSSILDFADFISNSVLMPIVALLTCVFVGWIVKPKTIIDEVRISSKFSAAGAWTIMIKYIAPVLVIIILVAYVAAQFGFFSM